MKSRDSEMEDPLPITPRTIKALRRIGLVPEARRAEKVDAALAERAKVIQEELEDESETVASSSCSFGSKALEQLVHRESRRLEQSIRDQLKRKSHAEHEIEKRAEKTRWLHQKLQARQLRVAQAQQLREAKAQELHEIHEARFSVRDQVQDVNREQFEARQQRLKAKQAEDRAKMDAFQREKQEQHNLTSEQYAIKQQVIHEKANQLKEERRMKNRALLEERVEKLEAVEQRRSRRLRLQQLRGEETTLRVRDALAKKQQQERIDAVKREQIGAILSEELTQAHLLDLSKEQVVRQRRFVAESQLKLVPLPEQVEDQPGPCEYDPLVSAMKDSPVPKFSSVKPKLSVPGTVDFETARAASLPGPGMYDYSLGGAAVTLSWSGAKKRTFVEEHLRAKLDLPGPASYDTHVDTTKDGGVRISRETFQRLDRGQHWRPAADTPGPASYTTDTFTRKEQVLKMLQKFETPVLALPTISEAGPDPMHEITDVYEIYAVLGLEGTVEPHGAIVEENTRGSPSEMRLGAEQLAEALGVDREFVLGFPADARAADGANPRCVRAVHRQADGAHIPLVDGTVVARTHGAHMLRRRLGSCLEDLGSRG